MLIVTVEALQIIRRHSDKQLSGLLYSVRTALDFAIMSNNLSL